MPKKVSLPIDFNRKMPLGRGEFGTVYQGTFNGMEVAVKRIIVFDLKDQLFDSQEEKIMKEMNHENVLKLYHVHEDEDFKYSLRIKFCM